MRHLQHHFCHLLYLVSAAAITHSQNDSCQLEGQIRLQGGAVSQEGRIELCRGRVWGTICDNDWDESGAAVVCRQLGFQETGAIPRRDSAFWQGAGTIHQMKYFCTGKEHSLIQCSSEQERCQHNDEAGVICSRALCSNGDIHLTDGLSENSGSVEVCINQQWTSIADNNWTRQDAGVVCKQLGYTYSGATPLVTTDLTFRPRGLQFVNCTGEESKLIDCASQSLVAPDLSMVPTVGVYCLNSTMPFSVATSTGSADILTTPILTTDFSISGNISPWIAAGVCAGVLLTAILLLLICLLAVCCFRLRDSRQRQSLSPSHAEEDNNIMLNNNESYACPPLPVVGLLEERENPCYEQVLPKRHLVQENQNYGNNTSYKSGTIYENFHEVSGFK